jgi:hypothetical protein
MNVQHSVARAIKVYYSYRLRNTFMYRLILEDASLLRHVSVQLRTIFRRYTCGPYENYYAYEDHMYIA